MWEDIKTNNYRYLLIVGAVILLCAGICGWWYYESSRAKTDYHDVNDGLGRAQDGIRSAELGVKSTQTEIDHAQNGLRRANATAGEIAERTRRDAGIINECESIVERCQERSIRIQDIIRRVEEQNKEYGTQTSSHT
ncbi:hypothetical protein [Dialister invisus]|uniref:hypothetical protein n=1 Tax=Dialister invisus TaxID=218538 RepID=UPI002658B8C6|nr:hypothetical protein [Dialister invisus]